MSLSVESRVVAIKDQVSCELDGEAVVLNLDDSIYYGLNETSLAIWQLIQKPTFVWEIRDEIVREFDVEPGACERDIINILDQMSGSSLIEIDT